VNAAAHTVTVSTTHFSTWALAVTDPQELAEEEAMDRQLSHTIGGKLGALIAGDQDALDCSPGNLLLAAQMSDDAALTPKLCEEVVKDGSYRLQYINTTGTPQLIHLPDGFTEHDPSRELDPLLGRLLADGGGTGSSSGYGCVDSSSQPLVAQEGTETVRGPDGLDHGYTWSIDYYRLLDLQWTHVATRTGKVASVQARPPAAGSDCGDQDPAHRGPDIGTP
jgi:hypothetical protein